MVGKKQGFIKLLLIFILLIGSLMISYFWISNVRNEKIKGGVYYGVKLGMEKDEVKDRLKIRGKEVDEIPSDDGNTIITFLNFNLLADPNFYVDEAFMFKENKLDVIFINIKCNDPSLVEKMKKDSIDKFVEKYGNFELIDNDRSWKKEDAIIYMTHRNPSDQIITVIIRKQ